MATTHATAAEVLRRVPLFADLTETEIKFLAERAVPRRYAPGELVFAEGDACPGLFVIESGNVRLFKSSPGGREQVLTIEKAGNSIAELPVFDGGNYPASATAVDEAQLLFVSKQDFHSLCLVHPKVALKVLRVVGNRLRRLVNIIEELSFTTVRSRLISLLLRLAREQAPGATTNVQITLPASNQELAAHIGTVRELVSRNISRLQAEALIKVDGRTVTIPKLSALQDQLESGE
ncbi:MAG: Crp/Fnr family transcriptional regulator [Acidobacteriia bacterium]|nr:Crp/Fnr family transcriptional regulator [Terriglobia bacterium]